MELLPEFGEEADRPLDHGVWVPLMNAWPAPDFPVCQLSLCPGRGARWHLELGEALAPLRDEGVLVIGSGGIVHNLRRIDWQAAPDAAEPWAVSFLAAVERAIDHHDHDALCDPLSLPHGRECVPTMEHYLPLLVALGAAGEESFSALFRRWEYGCLSLHSYGTDRPKNHQPEEAK